MPPEPERDAGQDFLRLLRVAVTAGIAVTAGFLQSIQSVNPAVRFEFSWRTVLWTLGAAAVSWRILGRVLSPPADGKSRSPLKLLVGFGALLVAGIVAAFVWGLRGAPTGQQREMLEGVGLAVALLAFIGFVLRRLIRFLERDAENHGPPKPPEPPGRRD